MFLLLIGIIIIFLNNENKNKTSECGKFMMTRKTNVTLITYNISIYEIIKFNNKRLSWFPLVVYRYIASYSYIVGIMSYSTQIQKNRSHYKSK